MDRVKIAIVALASCAALAVRVGPAAAQSSAESTLPQPRTQPIFAPDKATLFLDADYYGQHDRRSVYKRDDDVVQVQGGAVIRAAPEASFIVGANYNHVDGRKRFPTTGSYDQEGGSIFAGATAYLATNYAVSLVGGAIRNGIDEGGLGTSHTATDHRLLKGGFVSANLDANYLYSGGRVALFAHYLYYEGAEGESVQSDGAFRPKFKDTLGRFNIGGEIYGRTSVGSTVIEPMFRAAVIYDANRLAFYNTRAALELATGANVPLDGSTLALRAFGTFGRREYRTFGIRLSLYHSL
jgi:hypothetical protein